VKEHVQAIAAHGGTVTTGKRAGTTCRAIACHRPSAAPAWAWMTAWIRLPQVRRSSVSTTGTARIRLL